MNNSGNFLSLAAMLEDLLAHRVGVTEAARYIAASRFPLKQSKNSLFLPFVGIDSQTDKFPLGAVRREWAPDALAHYDQERERVEKKLANLASTAAAQLLVWITRVNSDIRDGN